LANFADLGSGKSHDIFYFECLLYTNDSDSSDSEEEMPDDSDDDGYNDYGGYNEYGD
jgi:hypothetical protein